MNPERQYLIPEIQRPWKRWFAWRPVRLFGSNRVVWLRTVERRDVWFLVWMVEYRLPRDALTPA